MTTREWDVMINGQKLTVMAPEPDDLVQLDQAIESIEDSFYALALSSMRGVIFKFEQPGLLPNELPKQFQITLTPAQARDLAQWLMARTANLD